MKTLRVHDLDLDITDDLLVLYNGEPFTGICYDLNTDGKLWSEISYVDGCEEGSKEWYPSGKLKAEDKWIGKVLHTSEWFEDGRLKQEIEFEFGIRVSEKEWDSDGNMIHIFQISENDEFYDLLFIRRKEHNTGSD